MKFRLRELGSATFRALMRRRHAFCTLALAACIGCSTLARAEDYDSSLISVYSGAEVDDEDGTRFDLGASISTRRGTLYSLAASRAEVDSETQSLVSTSAALGIDHDFGRFGVNAEVRPMRQEDVSESLSWLAGAYADFDLLRVGATFEWRDVELDQTTFTASGTELGLSGITSAAGTADCSVQSTGYGLTGRLDRPRWSVYASAAGYDYSGYDCTSNLTALTIGTNVVPVAPGSRAPINARRPGLFRRMAVGLTRRFDGATASRIPRETALLESTLMAGAELVTSTRTTFGAEIYRDSDEFAPDSTETFLGYLDYRATEILSITATLGSSNSDSLGRFNFVGLRLAATL
jgi:hypothetical protein